MKCRHHADRVTQSVDIYQTPQPPSVLRLTSDEISIADYY